MMESVCSVGVCGCVWISRHFRACSPSLDSGLASKRIPSEEASFLPWTDRQERPAALLLVWKAFVSFPDCYFEHLIETSLRIKSRRLPDTSLLLFFSRSTLCHPLNIGGVDVSKPIHEILFSIQCPSNRRPFLSITAPASRAPAGRSKYSYMSHTGRSNDNIHLASP